MNQTHEQIEGHGNFKYRIFMINSTESIRTSFFKDIISFALTSVFMFASLYVNVVWTVFFCFLLLLLAVASMKKRSKNKVVVLKTKSEAIEWAMGLKENLEP